MIAEAIQTGKTLRAMGASWSLSKVGVTEHRLINTKNLSLAFPLDNASISPEYAGDRAKLRFMEAAATVLVEEALQTGQSVRDLCAARFKDYQFGLKLIAQNSAQAEFEITEEAVRNPDKVLSDWVVASYRREGQGQA